MDIKAGDVVELKSGGPDMTVRDVEGAYAWCQWFHGMEVKCEQFAFASLKTVAGHE